MNSIEKLRLDLDELYRTTWLGNLKRTKEDKEASK